MAKLLGLGTRKQILNMVRTYTAPAGTASASQSIGNVSGLSKKVVDVPAEAVGPGASKKSDYKNPEYFCYNNISYFEAEVEMAEYRLPQPSSKKSK